jgi:hypothetical protein
MRRPTSQSCCLDLLAKSDHASGGYQAACGQLNDCPAPQQAAERSLLAALRYPCNSFGQYGC